MPQDPATSLSALLRTTTLDDDEEILKAANATLRANKSDEVAQHTRVVALLKLDRFEDAVRAITEGGAKLEASCVLEKAYSLYKLGRLEEATRVLSTAGIQKRSLSLLTAQVAYRAENFDEAQSVYNRLLAENPGEEGNDLNINIKAAQAQAEWSSPTTLPGIESDIDLDSFELCYNAACIQIARGSLEMAARLLQRALALCDASDDLKDEDKEEERKPIKAQQAYVFARMGDANRATGVYRTLDTTSDTDPDFKLIAQNNRWVLDKAPQNPFVMERQISMMSARGEAKLFKFQSSCLDRNSSLVDLHAKKLNGVKDRAQRSRNETKQPNTSPSANVMSVVAAAAETQGLSGPSTLHSLIDLSRKRPNDTGLVLTIVQHYLQRKKLGAAIHVLESFFSRLEKANDDEHLTVRYSPGLVALAVSLKRLQERDSSAKLDLVKAAKFWRNRPVGPVSTLLREAGTELAKSSNKEDLDLAGATLGKLHDEEKESEVTAAGLVAALAVSKVNSVEKHIGNLPPIPSLIGDIHVESLVNKGVAISPNCSSLSKKRAAPAYATDGSLSNKRRRRRMPRNVVDGQAPDPERWLPLRDRSSYRPKGKKGKKKATESTQGGVVKEEETLGLVGGGGVKVEKASSSNAAKKKKKGKK